MGVRSLRGHKAPITALHAGGTSEETAFDGAFGGHGGAEEGMGGVGGGAATAGGSGFLLSGAFDGGLRLWDPTLRGDELRANLHGHQG